MPEINTHADAVHAYLSGAASDGGAQASHDASLGNYRSSTALAGLGVTVTSPISGVTVDYAAHYNGTGSGTLAAPSADTLTWRAPNGSTGAAVAIANGETKILEDGSDPSKYIKVSRTSASALTGTATLTLADVVNNVIGLDNVSSAEASAGDDEYRAFFLQNDGAAAIENLAVWIGTLGTQAVSGVGQLGASGAGTITTAGSFADWPASGWCHIKNGASTREIVYYTSRTNTALTVPAAGRGRLGTSAAAGAATDTLDAVPGIRIASEAPSSLANGYIQTIAGEGTAPTGTIMSSWSTGITAATGLTIGTLAAGEQYGLWIHREIPAGAVATPSMLNYLRRSWDGT